MTDWTKSYGVTFEYWEVDKDTFKDKRQLYNVETAEITRDVDDPTLGDATMTVDEYIDKETYIRCYLIAEQPPASGNTERVCLGTFLAQVSELQMDGKVIGRPLELSTPLKELDDDQPPDGYTVRKNTNAIAAAYDIFSRHHVHVNPCSVSKTMPRDVTANDSDTWLTFGRAVLEAVDMEPTLDPYGHVGFAAVKSASALSPVWNYADDEVSIIDSNVNMKLDWHNVPNVVEVVVSTSGDIHKAICTNNDPSSPVSTVSRGRIVKNRVSNPEGVATKEQAEAYAARELKKLSNAEREVTYTHGYCPVRIGDGIQFDYTEHEVSFKAKVVRQVIRCQTDFEVEETARYTEALWNG